MAVIRFELTGLPNYLELIYKDVVPDGYIKDDFDYYSGRAGDQRYYADTVEQMKIDMFGPQALDW